MENFEDDLDFALELQLQEAMNFSLLETQLEPNDTFSDSQTLELVSKLEQERRDAVEWEAEMRRIRGDLKIQSHDHNFAEEILRIPEDEWVKYGDNVHKPFAEASSSSSKQGNEDGEPFRLYFKGLFSGEIAAIGAAVCDGGDNLILNVQKHLSGDWKSDWEEENLQFKVEVKALMEGLNVAIFLDIKKIDIFCDFYPLYHYITEKWLITQEKIATVVDQVCLLQRKFDSCRPFFVARNDVKFAFKLARDAIDTQISRCAGCSYARNVKETCNICLEDTDVTKMFSIDGCLHSYCILCMRQHVEVKLLHGVVPICPFEGCRTQLDILICKKFLSPELIDLMDQRKKESSIPVTDKIYCPNPRCSELMSKSTLLPYANAVCIEWSATKCIKCQCILCINCKVPWHSNLTCTEFQWMNPSPSVDDAQLKSLATTRSWRQCTKCDNMIELAEGCYHITCRCGYEFCYTCGAEWRNKKATCTCPIWDEHNIVNDPVQFGL